MKNDDMDELFRKAAENYEVDTSKASGWDAVNKALRNADGFNIEKQGKEKKKRRFFFWWFLLLPALFAGYYTWKKTGATNKEDIIAKTESAKATKDTNERPVTKSSENTIINKLSADTEEYSLNESPGNRSTIIEKDENKNALAENNIISNKKNRTENNPASNFIEHKENSQDHEAVLNNGERSVTEKNSTTKNGGAITSANTHHNRLKKNKKTFDNNNPRKPDVVDRENNTNNKAIVQYLNNNNKQNKQTNNIGISRPDGDSSKTITGSFQYVFTDHDGKMLPVISFEGKISGMAPGIKGLNAGNADSSAKQNKNKTDKKYQHYFYAAAVVAPDLSSVKFQRIAGTGSSTGLLLGYRLNNHWHIETGALWEKKIYCTEGKYFDKSKLSPYLRDVEIMNADGNCYMITIPLNVRYNILTGKNSNWFIATGMSSYLMNKEYYDFTYRHPGGQPMTKGYEYKTAEKNWMTVINLNLGYERTFLKTFNFRIEPYFRLPVSGVGTGNLSLTSGGIYIGIGKKF
ncbi:MAG: outer membrane beta-barrel protein [Agriterribacter sp.]